MADTIYSPTGEIISSTAARQRYFNVKVYIHTKDPVNASSDASTYNQQFSKPNEGDIALNVSKLRCTFDIKRYALYYPNTALITIYNLSAATENAVIMEGYRVTVDAGYLDLYGKIFDGTVLMCTRWKENATDYCLQILAIDGNDFILNTFCSFTYQKGQTMRSVIETMAMTGGIKLDSNASKALDQPLAKGGAVNGLAKNYLTDYTKSINGTWYVDNGRLYVFSYSDDPANLPNGLQAVTLSEKTGMIGNPIQHQQGVNARCLINPKIVPYSLVQIKNEKITQELVSVSSYSEGISFPYALDPQGLYRVISVNFIGDTRGNDWYCDINTVSQAGNIPQTLSGSNSTLN